MRIRRLLGIGTLTGLLAAAALSLAAAPAQAHNTLVSSSPAAGSVVTEQPGTFAVTTNDALLEAGGTANAIQVRGPGAEPLYYGDGCMTVQGPTLTTPVTLGQPGEYTVIWQVVSADGHPIDGEFTFTWQPAEGQELAEGLASAPVCGQSRAPVESGTPTPEPTFTTQTDSSGTTDAVAPEETSAASSDILWIGGALAIVVVAAVVVLIVLRRKSATSAAAADDESSDTPRE
ncbi:methionine-rich copper-binding protein CopC [Okibacterium sp. HSC-33S16]|uniref:copper resistance CopC family protein n=1 Tax=Okibacterium sp. HSC-33S16 TaxID=2910965 RepID=UPI00209DD659|nr:copper resistance CopC family protein [Okibacterium sp. HSC-33S16]MCP2031528.1 methionine-rich copper-binding protein CopC [Okibacterium sp. HSC-33S16]